ncbi:MAG: hypothetical protein JXL97_04070 [Bacteroidales bacterium]|nr:hypothetical protein [Bacteroidales bacterium]
MSTVVEKRVTEKASSKDAVINSISIKAIENNVKGEKTEKQPKEVEKKAISPVPEIVQPLLTLEQKIERIENLKTLIEKREKLEASRKKLNSFVVGANQFSENIVLTDENGNSFRTSNSEVFTKVVDTIKNTLIAKISEIEQQIEF